jgi:hypothetical protein
MKKFINLTVIVVMIWLSLQNLAVSSEKQLIGPTAVVVIKEAGIRFDARVDTGAGTTSINAQNIKQSGGTVVYTIVNGSGQQARLSSKIIKQAIVKNAESSEKRMYVYLTLEYNGDIKTTLVNLNDRSNSSYKLLLGRNWLAGRYLVDVDM